MNTTAFARMIAKQGVVVGLSGNDRLASVLAEIGRHFANKTGMVAKHLPATQGAAKGRNHSDVVELLRATADVHRTASAKSTAATATEAVADALARSEERTVTAALASWSAPPQMASPPAKQGAASSKSVAEPTELVVRRYVERLRAQPASASLGTVDQIAKDKAVKLPQLTAIIEQVTGRTPPKRTKGKHVEALRRYFVGQRAMDEKDEAFARR
ncbi:hypothetical protein [Acuticoccus sp.]|uniref:hypothetical protein n=1 Tax=Acuticoccus sp. TaxID=1904378 RepID=UPI003B51D35D